jgi:protein involved in temperature-dependent protein secretion
LLGSALLLTMAYARLAGAAPQVSTGLTLGVAANGDRSNVWSSTSFSGGVRGDLLWARTRDADFGIGPYAEVLTTTGKYFWIPPERVSTLECQPMKRPRGS